MSNISQVNPKESNKLYQELYSNHQVLTSTGALAAENGNYGVAISLTILGAEEFSKAIVMNLHGKGVNVFDIKELKQIFHKHKRKHEVAMLFELIKILEVIINSSKPKRIPSKAFTRSKKINKLIGYYNMARSIIEPIVQMKNHFTWWENADNMKNKGLYVDYRNDTIISPFQITKEEYETAMDVISDFKNRSELLRSILEKEKGNNENFKDQINQSIALMK